MPSSEPYLDVDLGPHNRIVKFSSAEEVQHFVEAEFETWSWLSAPPVQGDAGNPWPTVSKAFHQIRGAIQKVNNETSEPLVSALKRSLEQAFRSQRIPLSSSAVGAFIQDVRSESAITAAAALATWMGTGGVNYANFEQVKGAVLIAAFDADMTSRTPAAVKRSLRNLSQQFQNSREKTERETLEQRQTFSRERLEHRNALARALRRGRRDTKRFHDRNQSAINETVISFRKEALEATTSILETEALYREHMRLKGPVEYWSNKAKEHRINAQSRQRFLVWFSLIAGTFLIAALYYIASHAIEISSNTKPPAVYLILVTLGVVITTIVFWAGRILTRLFLSEHHLAIDAEERAVMAQTYLALTAEGQAGEKERDIVLTSLFRPTADGIVKDDAAPDLSPAALLARLGSR